MVLSDSMQEIVIRIPDGLLNELDGHVQLENSDRSDFMCKAAKMYLREEKQRHIRESMRRGYMEMAKINLTIASEAFQAEEEADHTLEQLVSGV